jgi:hypothetical protein
MGVKDEAKKKLEEGEYRGEQEPSDRLASRSSCPRFLLCPEGDD